MVFLLAALTFSVLIGVKVTGTNQWPGFGREQRYTYGGQIGADIVTADFNGDGATDLAVPGVSFSDPSQGQVSILLGNGDGTMLLPTFYRIDIFPRKIAPVTLHGLASNKAVIKIK